MNSDLLFPPGKWQMSASGRQIVAKLAKQLAAGQQNRIYVSGYTDNAPVGSGAETRGRRLADGVLSRKRAEDVKSFLASQGFRPELLLAQGYGEGRPVASNGTPQGRAQNRRVRAFAGAARVAAAPGRGEGREGKKSDEAGADRGRSGRRPCGHRQ